METKFIARTRLRGTVDYYKAIWRKEGNDWNIRFLQGPNKGAVQYRLSEVAIAQDEAWQITGRR